MKAGLRLRIAMLMAALAGAGDAAASAAQEAQAPPANEVVGPPQLRDFSLGGTVTRRPEPAPQQEPAPQREPPVRSTARPSSPAPQPGPDSQAAAPSATPRSSAAPSAPAARSVTLQLPQAMPGTSESGASGSGLESQPAIIPETLPPSASMPIEEGPSLLPWLFAALLLGGMALYFASHRRARLAAAGPAPAPEPLERAAAPPSRAPPPSPAAAVTTRVRPWLELTLNPERLVFDGTKASLQFELIAVNTGSAPARDVLIEAALFNAGAAQDEEIGAFFAHPRGQGDRLEEIAPMRTVKLRSAVELPAAQIRVFDIEGRKLFVPLAGFTALYSWRGGDGQTSASYLIGRDTSGEKMGPFHLHHGPRVFRGLGAREHGVRVRK